VVVAAGGIAGIFLGRPVWVALGLAALVQAPLGWWLAGTIGTRRFLAAWVTGMGARLAVVVAAAFAILPAFKVPAEAGLLALVATLMALLGVELYVVVSAERSKGEAR
jgi:hypothetical protein